MNLCGRFEEISSFAGCELPSLLRGDLPLGFKIRLVPTHNNRNRGNISHSKKLLIHSFTFFECEPGRDGIHNNVSLVAKKKKEMIHTTKCEGKQNHEPKHHKGTMNYVDHFQQYLRVSYVLISQSGELIVEWVRVQDRQHAHLAINVTLLTEVLLKKQNGKEKNKTHSTIQYIKTQSEEDDNERNTQHNNNNNNIASPQQSATWSLEFIHLGLGHTPLKVD